MSESRSGDNGWSARVCLRVTKERQRSTRPGEGSTRSEKDHGESASSALNKAPVRGAPDCDRLKLATANSFVDPPFPDHANGRG
jgi:hypothetical protein